MGFYRKKPPEVEARQLTAENGSDLMTWIQSFGRQARLTESGTICLNTRMGEVQVNVGDYIIRGSQGDFYPSKPDIFNAGYELAPE